MACCQTLIKETSSRLLFRFSEKLHTWTFQGTSLHLKSADNFFHDYNRGWKEQNLEVAARPSRSRRMGDSATVILLARPLHVLC